MNINTLEKLQYEELKNIVKSYCVSGLGRDLIDKLEPSGNISLVEKRLSETSEGVTILDMANHIPLDGISNIKNIIDNIEKGVIVTPGELIAITDFLRGCRKVKRFMKDKEDYAKTLGAYGDSIFEYMNIEEEIEKSINGSIVDSNASSTLKKIRRNIDVCEGKIQERLKKFLQNSSNKKYIQEFFISKRNNRYTIPIKASYKNHVDGNVIEVSSKGSTVFIEPTAVSKYTAELEGLKAEEVIEEYRILCDLCNLIYENIR